MRAKIMRRIFFVSYIESFPCGEVAMSSKRRRKKKSRRKHAANHGKRPQS
ncbi:hypothetical protein GQF42_40610 [Streptomyces broussonetiae]|uniref:Uncharacterized protein n=1 Tax=Streptomyces broussonetiae TaxID=2686304 RepID=A0A6I6NBF5_9ACTN|nr:hypothetical protein GQF42_40610 [Streptomyces broussonetiae]